MLSIGTNTGAIMAQAAASSVTRDMETAMHRLSTGKRINAAADDAAGVAISSRLDSTVRGLNQSIRNALDAQALIDTAEGGMQETESILQRIRELSIQAAADTNSADDRANLNTEVQSLLTEIDRISSSTTWAGQSLLDGTFTDKSFQVGTGTMAADQLVTSIAATSWSGLEEQVHSISPHLATGGLSAASDTGRLHSASNLGSVLGHGIVPMDDGHFAIWTQTSLLPDEPDDKILIFNREGARTGTILVSDSATAGYIFFSDNSTLAVQNTETGNLDHYNTNGMLLYSESIGDDFLPSNSEQIRLMKSQLPAIYSSGVNMSFTHLYGQTIESADYFSFDFSIDHVAAGLLEFTPNSESPLLQALTNDRVLILQTGIDENTNSVNYSNTMLGQVFSSTGEALGIPFSVVDLDHETFQHIAATQIEENKFTLSYTTRAQNLTPTEQDLYPEVNYQGFYPRNAAVKIVDVFKGPESGEFFLDSPPFIYPETGSIDNFEDTPQTALLSTGEVVATWLTSSDDENGSEIYHLDFQILSSDPISLTSNGAAKNTISKIDVALQSLNSQRASLGAISNRLDHIVANNTNAATNVAKSLGRIQDADFAAESTSLAKDQILQQASTAMLAQANASKQNILELLQN